MNKAYFYRKAESIKDYDSIILNYKEYTDCLSFIIAKKILLNDEQYNSFINNFMIEQTFIKDNIHLMRMDEYDVVSCLFVYCDNFDFGILVYSAGYKYARYVAKYFLNWYIFDIHYIYLLFKLLTKSIKSLNPLSS